MKRSQKSVSKRSRKSVSKRSKISKRKTSLKRSNKKSAFKSSRKSLPHAISRRCKRNGYDCSKVKVNKARTIFTYPNKSRDECYKVNGVTECYDIGYSPKRK